MSDGLRNLFDKLKLTFYRMGYIYVFGVGFWAKMMKNNDFGVKPWGKKFYMLNHTSLKIFYPIEKNRKKSFLPQSHFCVYPKNLPTLL